MAPLEPPDTHYLNAASGWLDLGNVPEATAELQRLSATAAAHPEVLALQWCIHAHARAWNHALATADRLIEAAPDNPGGWVDRSYALHELRRTEEAWTLLLPLARQFPRVLTIPYNLACYACQLGRLDETRRWLHEAARLKSLGYIKRMALKDADLKPLWSEIEAWPESEKA